MTSFTVLAIGAVVLVAGFLSGFGLSIFLIDTDSPLVFKTDWDSQQVGMIDKDKLIADEEDKRKNILKTYTDQLDLGIIGFEYIDGFEFCDYYAGTVDNCRYHAKPDFDMRINIGDTGVTEFKASDFDEPDWSSKELLELCVDEHNKLNDDCNYLPDNSIEVIVKIRYLCNTDGSIYIDDYPEDLSLKGMVLECP